LSLPLCGRGDPSPVAAADEKVDPAGHGGSVHVAKGGLPVKMLDASPFKPPAVTWLFNL
jgi:hypothetical protein